MQKNIIWVIVLLVGGAFNCTILKKTAGASSIAKIDRPPCLGKCPVYTFEVYTDKTVHYNGIKNVARQGSEIIKLSDKEYKALIDLFSELPFSEYQTEYKSQMRDIPLIFVTYQEKKIKMEQNKEPQELQNLVRHLEKRFRILE